MTFVPCLAVARWERTRFSRTPGHVRLTSNLFAFSFAPPPLHSHTGDVSLYQNQLTGVIPDWTPINSLSYLDFGHNLLTGNLTESLIDHRQLRRVYLNNNQLTGTIPSVYPALGSLKLTELHLDHNQLTGQVPEDWTNGHPYQKFLLALRLEENHFSGQLSSKLCDQDVRRGKAEMVELRADCDICSCSLCKDHCTEVQSGLGDAPNGAHHAEKEVDKRSEKEKEGKGFLG